MAVERVLSFSGLVLMAMLAPLVISSGRYVIQDPDYPREEKAIYHGDPINIFANKVHPEENHCEQYPYFDLPFCPPAEAINDGKKSLGEVLAGDCFTPTGYELYFGEDIERNLLCEKTLTKDEVAKFREAVKRNFQYQMRYDKHLFRGMVGRVALEEGPKYYLATHIRFHFKYSYLQVDDIYVLSDYNSDVDITEAAEIKVNFTYSAYWDEAPYNARRFLNDTPFEHLMRLEEEHQIWNSRLTYWASVAVVWVGLLLAVTVPYLMSYFRRYSHGVEENMDTRLTTPRHIHGDNCKCPPYTSLLGAILGNGNQLLITVWIFFILAYNGFLYPCNLQSLSSQILRTYCFTSVVAGIKATAFHAGFSPVGWKECIFQAGTVYFIPALSTALFANGLVIANYGISQVPEFGIISENLAVWGPVTGILLIISSILSCCSKSESELTCATRKLSRENRQQPWYVKTPAQMLLGGLVPFIVIFPKMDNIYASLWHLKICSAFRTLLTSFIAIVVMTVILAVAFSSYQLSQHDYHWWWRSVLRGGSPAILMFFYGLYFFSRVDFEVPLLLRVLGYHACMSYAFFLMLGTIGYYASSFVFHCTYHLRKHD
ncbi:Nonaspanin [Trema orientale]|uniref:Transmembrane 9 superfamily member n=1 Tax=Trema orientale TaxID=63057 RepID=A0A2P5EC42_TREOI|nr:Nonaspanin [Trema orientale]